MNKKRIKGNASGPLLLIPIVMGLLLIESGCQPKSTPAKSASPAKVEMVPHESDLATLTLTTEAVARLGISTVTTETGRFQQHRTFGGEIVVPSGRSIMVSAPLAGIVSHAGSSKIPVPGSKVKAGDIVLALAPLLTPERDVPTPAEQMQMASAKATLVAAQVSATGEMQRGRAEMAASKITLDRAKKLLSDRAGSQRAVDDAQALVNVASTVFAAAEERFKELTKLIASLESSSAKEKAVQINLRAPVDGVVRTLNISEGQQVVGGASLFEVLDTNTVWVRVPIFVDLLSSILQGTHGRVVSLDGKMATRTMQSVNLEQDNANPVDAPPTADAASSSADLYFEIANSRNTYRPGQRIGIELPLNSEVEAIVVPASSVLYDIHGGTWVYTQKEPQRFVRQRVTVMWFDGSQAILDKGPRAGTMVVADGAAELFGTEFGPGK